MAGATCGTVVAIRTTPDLDASSVSSACGGGGEDTSSNSTDTNRANDDGGEIEDLEEEDSFISCSLHSTREEENDIPWDVWKTPEKDQENSDRNSNPQVVVVVYQPQQQESVPDHPSPIALLPRQLIGQRRKRTALIQSGCLADGISILPSCEESVYAGCYPDDSAFADNKIMCNILVGLWGGPDDDDDDAREPSETEFVTVAVEVRSLRLPLP